MDNLSQPVVVFEAASVSNGEIPIVDNIDLTIGPGEFVYLTGKVGSGKTTIIRTITGENRLVSGEASVCGIPLAGLRKKQIPYLRRSLGIIFQDFQLLMDRTVEDNLRFVLQATGWKDQREMNIRITQALELVGIASKAHKMPHQLSGGEQQRAAIARALLNEPRLILADEPTGNLDDETAHSIMDLLFKINALGTAVLMVTHNQVLIKEYPARILVVADGRCKDLREE